MKGLEDENHNVHGYAIAALAATGKDSPSLFHHLLGLFQDRRTDLSLRTRAIATLAALGTTTNELRQSLIEALHEEGLPYAKAWSLRFASVRALGKVGEGDPQVIAALEALLPEDSNTSTVARGAEQGGTRQARGRGAFGSSSERGRAHRALHEGSQYECD